MDSSRAQIVAFQLAGCDRSVMVDLVDNITKEGPSGADVYFNRFASAVMGVEDEENESVIRKAKLILIEEEKAAVQEECEALQSLVDSRH